MATTTPISTAVLDMVLLNDDQESALYLGQGSQRLRLELTNLTNRNIELAGGGGASLRLTFRPGALSDVSGLAVSGDQWTGSVVEPRQEIETLVLIHQGPLTIAPQQSRTITIDGLVPSAAGGSRSTRVELEYRDVHLVGEGPVNGRRILHLSLLHPSVPAGMIAGSMAESGPFTAEIESSGEVVTGGTDNLVRVKLATSVPTPVTTLTATDEGADAATRFTFSMPSVAGDRLEVSSYAAIGGGRWSSGGVGVIRSDQVRAKTLRGDFMTVTVKVTTNHEPGLYPLSIKWANVEGKQGELVLLLRVTAIGVAAQVGRGDITATRALTVEGNVQGHSFGMGEWRMGHSTSQTVDFAFLTNGRPAGHSFYFQEYKDSTKANRIGTSSGRALNIASTTGKVGVNLDNPEHALDIGGHVRAHAFRVGEWRLGRGANAAVDYAYLNLGSPSGHSFYFQQYKDASKANQIGTSSGRSLNITSSDSKVGVNKTDPEWALDVWGDVKAHSYRIGQWRIGVSSHQIQFRHDEKLIFVIDRRGWTATYDD